MATALYLPTHDLRIIDNPCLSHAASFEQLHIGIIVEPSSFQLNRYQSHSMGQKRWTFLAQGIADFTADCQRLGNLPTIYYDDCVTAVGHMLMQTDAQHLIVSRPVGWYEQQKLLAIQKAYPQLKIKLFDTYTLFDTTQGAWLGDELPRQFTPFRRLAEKASVARPIAALDRLPPSPLSPTAQPSLPEVDNTVCFMGGEQAGSLHLHAYFSSSAPRHYKTTRNALTGWTHSTKFSLWLSQGAISARVVWQMIMAYEQARGANDSTAWLYVELLWREYFQWLSRQLGPQLYRFRGIAKQPPLTSFYAQRWQAWCQGETGCNLVDAIMHELNETGYISNRSRQIAASYCVNELQLDWRYGAAWFEQQLIDYDVASNWGNWQYIAGVGVDPRGGRHFDVNKQQTQFDPEGEYIARWLGHAPSRHSAAFVDAVDAADWPLFKPLR